MLADVGETSVLGSAGFRFTTSVGASIELDLDKAFFVAFTVEGFVEPLSHSVWW